MKRKFLFIPQNDNNVKWLFYFAPKVPSSYGFDIAWHLTFWRFARYSPASLYRYLSLKIFAKRLTTLFFCGILCPELNLTRFVSLCQFPKSFPRIAPKPSALISKTAAFAQLIRGLNLNLTLNSFRPSLTANQGIASFSTSNPFTATANNRSSSTSSLPSSIPKMTQTPTTKNTLNAKFRTTTQSSWNS